MKIAIIGAGNMGGAIAIGLVKSKLIQACDIIVSNPSTEKLESLKGVHPNIQTTTNNCVAASFADIVFLAVKPWKAEDVINEIKPSLDYSKQVIVSVIGGVSSEQLDKLLLSDNGLLPQLYLIIPNTAITIGSGVTFISGRRTNEIIKNHLLALFSTMGKTMYIDEALMPAATSLASCGIAYALQYIKVATEGGVQLGFSHEESLSVVMQTIQGALDVLRSSGSNPTDEIARVTTPGGLTLRGLQAMEESGFEQAVINGLRASTIIKN